MDTTKSAMQLRTDQSTSPDPSTAVLPSYSSVAAQPAVARPARLPTLSTAAVTAVYVDKLEKERRANGVIVTGLQSSPSHSD